MTQNLRYTHMQGEKKKSFALLTMTGKKLPERCLIIDHNILVLKKILKKKISTFKLQPANLLPIMSGLQDRQPSPYGKWPQTTSKISVSGKVKGAQPPAHLPPPINAHQTSLLSDTGPQL